jgi:DNA-binding NtrC family response regulator
VQDGEVDPVGGRSTVKVDIRLISATHRDLLQRVKDGKFREDLFYRLNVYPIMVPPLRDRRDDIPHLVRHFMARVPASGGRHQPVNSITPGALAMLQAYDWPGNIRQLENAVFRASVLSDGDVLTEEEFPQIRAQVEGTVDLGRTFSASASEAAADEAALPIVRPERPDRAADPAMPRAPAAVPASQAPRFGILKALDDRGNVRALADVELEMIRLAIDHYDGQMSEVARRLGIGRSTLYRKLKEYGIDPEAGRGGRPAA